MPGKARGDADRRAEFDERRDERHDAPPRPRPVEYREPWLTVPERHNGIIVNHAAVAESKDSGTCFYCRCLLDEHATRVTIIDGKRCVVPTKTPARKNKPA